MRLATIVAFAVSLVLQVSCPLAVTLVYRRRTRTSWQPFICGAMIYTVFQLFTWLPLSVYADVVISSKLATEMGAFLWLLGLAFSTSLVEESGRWVGFRYLFPRSNCELSWRNGVMYGLGHGAVETLLLIAGLTFIYFLAYIILGRLDLSELVMSFSGELDEALLQELRAVIKTTWTQPLTVAVERILAIPHQVAWSLLVLQSVAYRQKRWFGFAVLYHASVAVIVPGLARLAGFAVAESVNLLFAGFSFWLILKLRAVASE
ncbi:MAG: YhfC family intramembrane metalloprotease [Anaerolineae bacterium]|nr:YhfC family intramembrane metalloprotease [Anaerolineae bacterium]